MMLLYATTVRLGMLLKKRRMVWSAKCLEPQSKTLFMATVLSCTQPVAGEYGKTENRKRKRPLHLLARVGQGAFAPSRVRKALWDKALQCMKKR